MHDRRTFLGFAAALLPAELVAQSASTAPAAPREPTPQNPSIELARHALAGPLEGFEAALSLGYVPPRATSNPHRHPGFALGYVLEGQMLFGLNYETPQIVPAGGTFFEPIGVVHSAGGSAIAGTPGRRLVFTVSPKGAEPVILV